MPATTQDSRFDTSHWTSQEAEAGPSKATSSSSGDESAEEDNDEQELEDDDDDDDDVDALEDGNSHPLHSSDAPPLPSSLTPKELAAFDRKQRKRGIIYISRIPPGMTPPKVRHLLSGFGEVERIFLQDGVGKQREREQGGQQKRKKTRRFTEGWVEFLSKSTAKLIASSLNAQPIGFVSSSSRKANKNARRWQDDVWTMKYLPGFKWHMLSEQMAHERAAHASRLRTELSQSKVEQQDYLRKVERARVARNNQERKRQREEEKGKTGAGAASSKTRGDKESSVSASSTAAAATKHQDEQRMRTFKQRKPVLRDVREQADGEKKRKRGQDDDARGNSSKQGGPGGRGALDGVLSRIL